MPTADAENRISAPERTSRLHLEFDFRRGQTELARSFCESPLKIAKPFRQDDGSLRLCVMDSSPGLFCGDLYDTNFRLAEGAQVRIEEQSFAKIHPSRGGISRIEKQFHVAHSALLDYAPQPTMLFQDANLSTRSHAEIERGGALLWSEIVCAGRIARGEIFEFARYSSTQSVRYDGELVWCNRSRFCPRETDLRAVAAWGNHTHLGNFLAFGDFDSREIVPQMRAILSDFNDISGVSALHKNGIAVTLLGSHAWQLQRTIELLRDKIRSSLLVSSR